MTTASSVTRRGLSAIAIAALATLGLVVPASAPVGATNSIPQCTAPPGANGYEIAAGSTAGFSTGTFSNQLVLGGPSCLGGVYAVTISSPDGTSLGWSTVKTSTDQSPQALATTTDQGSSVVVQFLGDGVSSQFLLVGTVSKYSGRSVNLVVTTGAIGGSQNADRAPEGAGTMSVSCGGCGWGYS